MNDRGGEWALPETLETVEGLLPDSIRQLIEQQLTSIDAEQQHILAAGSVVGVEFSAAAVAVCIDQATDEIEAQCNELARRMQFIHALEMVEWPDGTIVARYQFNHDLYHEVLYDRVPVSRRVRWHQSIGVRLEAAYGARVQEVVAELALHFVRGRDVPRAVYYLQVAGEQALQQNAYQEAMRHLTTGLDLLQRLPETLERDQLELALHIAMGTALVATKGWTAPDVERTYTRAHVLGQQVGATPQLFPALFGLWGFYQVRAELLDGREVAEQLLTLGQGQSDSTLIMLGHRALGESLLLCGEVAASLVALEQSTGLFDSQQHRALAFHYGQDVGVTSRAHAAMALWLLGYPDQALHRAQSAYALAQELASPFNLAYSMLYVASTHALRREWHQAQTLIECLLALATEHGFAYWLMAGTILRGWTLTQQGQPEAGMTQMRQGLTAWQKTGAEQRLPQYLSRLAVTYGELGQPGEGLMLLAEACAIIDKNNERWWEAEVYRLEGELRLKQAVPEEPLAEVGFQQALTIAHGQAAKSLELRAATSLARLWQSQSKCQEAYDLLASVYGWFTEGFETADLTDAKSLLDELA